MSIRSIGTSQGVQRPAAPAPATSAEATSKVKAGGPPAHAPAHGARARQDSVAISDDARALAGNAGGAGALESAQVERSSLSAARVGELRKKVLEGAYNQAHVVDQVAKRLLSSGDV